MKKKTAKTNNEHPLKILSPAKTGKVTRAKARAAVKKVKNQDR